MLQSVWEIRSLICKNCEEESFRLELSKLFNSRQKFGHYEGRTHDLRVISTAL